MQKTLLYVSAHNPYPPRSGGQVDTWNRLKALAALGVSLHLVVTVKRMPSPDEQAMLRTVSKRLTFVIRRPLPLSLWSRKPVQMVARTPLRSLDLSDTRYSAVLLDNEFCGEILGNGTLRAERLLLRVHNDEAAYQCRLAESEPSWWKRRYFRMEMRRMRRYLPRLWAQSRELWFISSDELQTFTASGDHPALGVFLPAAIAISKAPKPALHSRKVLFVGTLTVSLNQNAIRWYLDEIHPRLFDLPEYSLIIAGSTGGKNVDVLLRELSAYAKVEICCDVPQLDPLFAVSGAFISPMRLGAGVKLKTVEAAMRGLPLVSTTVGIEGTGLLDGVHCAIADDPGRFAEAVRELLTNHVQADLLRNAAAEFIQQTYNQVEALHAPLTRAGVL